MTNVFSLTIIHRIVVQQRKIQRQKHGIVPKQKRIGRGVHTLTDGVTTKRENKTRITQLERSYNT